MNTVKILFSRCRSMCKPAIMFVMLVLGEEVIKCFPLLSDGYFAPSAGHWACLSCGQMSHFRCLPSLHRGQALAWSNCQSGCILVAFGRLCSRCGFCGCFHQAVWSLSEAQACQTSFFESVPALLLGR